jgi:hypothetical protein
VPLGDFFVPDPPLVCPLCGALLSQWDGFGGPGAFLVYKQGEAEPIEKRLPSQVPEGDLRLLDGTLPLFTECAGHHHLMAEAYVEGRKVVRIELRDVDGSDPLSLIGPFVLWRARGSRFAASTLAPTREQGVIPASITAIGFDEKVILASRRTDTRDPKAIDEWWLVDVGEKRVLGPLDDEGLARELAERGIAEPNIMKLPEEVR